MTWGCGDMNDDVRYYAPGAVQHFDNEMFVRAEDYERLHAELEQCREQLADAKEVFNNALYNFICLSQELKQARTWLRWAQWRLPEDVRESWQYDQLCAAANPPPED